MKGQIFCILMLGVFLGCNRPDSGINQNSPVINPPLVNGNYPKTPFLFAISTEGKRPVKWSAEGLPRGLDLDASTGIISGSYGYEEQDAMDFASWGIDLLKYDYWRTTLDIRNAWLLDVYNAGSNSIMQILDMNAPLADYAGPGHWNDPDMLVVGIDTSKTTVVNRAGAKGCTIEEYRSHMSLWCLMAAPLLAGNDIRNMNENVREILMNSEIIAVNQDPLGKQAKRIRDDGDAEVFAKPLSDGSWAVGLLNRNDSENKNIRIDWKELGINGERQIRDLWKHEDLGRFSDYFGSSVAPHQCVVVRIFNK